MDTNFRQNREVLLPICIEDSRMQFRSRQDGTGQRSFTALIDVVFLLLVFFMLTLRIVEPEGELRASYEPEHDVNATGETICFDAIDVRLRADAIGALQDVQLGGTSLGAGETGIERLRSRMRKLFSDDNAHRDLLDNLKIRLRIDSNLDYQHAVSVISACTGDARRVGANLEIVRYGTQVVFADP